MRKSCESGFSSLSKRALSNIFQHSGYSRLDHNDGQFFRAMEWLMFFLGHHCHQWFFNGFTIPGPSPLNVFYRSTIDIDGFLMVFSNSGAMVSDGFDLEKDLKMCIIVTDSILQQLYVLFRIQITLLLVNLMCK